MALVVKKELACKCRRHKRCGFQPWVRKIPWRRAWHPLQYSCLENPMDRGAGRAAAHGSTGVRRGSSDFACAPCTGEAESTCY